MSDEVLRIVGEVEIAKLSLRLGDVLVVKVDRVSPHEAVSRIRQSIEPLLPAGNKCMVIDPGIELSVLTGAEIAERTS